MEGMSERQYAAHVDLSRGAIQKAKESGRLVQHADGSIDAASSDARRAAMTDPAMQRVAPANAPPPAAKLKPVPDTALSAVGDTLREHGLVPPAPSGGMSYRKRGSIIVFLRATGMKIRRARPQASDSTFSRNALTARQGQRAAIRLIGGCCGKRRVLPG